MNIKDSPIKKYLEKNYIKKLSPEAIYEKYADSKRVCFFKSDKSLWVY